MDRNFARLDLDRIDLNAGSNYGSDNSLDLHGRGKFQVARHVGLTKTAFSGWSATTLGGAPQNPKKVLGVRKGRWRKRKNASVRFRPIADIRIGANLGPVGFRTYIIRLAISFGVFAACCVVMLRFGSQLNSKVFVYPFMAVWGLSAVVWPFFAVRAVRQLLSGR